MRKESESDKPKKEKAEKPAPVKKAKSSEEAPEPKATKKPVKKTSTQEEEAPKAPVKKANPNPNPFNVNLYFH